ncbi:MAG TPA: DUF4169 family protein [Vineibacter sp.]|nr:DUF4169 family protein [Vineibacter sp.]
MAEILNLRRARKDKARAERGRTAEANRLKSGRPKADKARDRLEDARARRTLDAHRRDKDSKS